MCSVLRKCVNKHCDLTRLTTDDSGQSCATTPRNLSPGRPGVFAIAVKRTAKTNSDTVSARRVVCCGRIQLLPRVVLRRLPSASCMRESVRWVPATDRRIIRRYLYSPNARRFKYVDALSCKGGVGLSGLEYYVVHTMPCHELFCQYCAFEAVSRRCAFGGKFTHPNRTTVQNYSDAFSLLAAPLRVGVRTGRIVGHDRTPHQVEVSGLPHRSAVAGVISAYA